MSDHDSDYVSDYSTDSDPPRQHPLFAAMDRITASVAAASINTTPSQAAPVTSTAGSTAGGASSGAAPKKDAEAEAAAQPRTSPEGKDWPLLTLRDFTLYTVTAIKNGEMEDGAEKTSMSEKYKAYCHNHELMKPVIDALANYGQETRNMIHQLVHTMLDNLGTGYAIERSIEDIPRDISRLHKDFGILHFHCLNKPSFNNPSIINCLADYSRLAHGLLSALDSKVNQENIWAHCRKIGAILAKIRRNEQLTEEEEELSERDGDKSMTELEHELSLVQTPSFERFIMQVATFTKLCIEEAEKQIEAEKMKGKEKEEVGVRDEKKEEEDDKDNDEGDSNSTIKAT